MNPHQINSISIFVLAILILVGGIMGYTKKKSKASLIAGTISALLLGVCAWVTYHHLNRGSIYACLVTAVLEGIFIVRLIRTRKFMPSGLMVILCLIEQGILLQTLSSSLHY